jgi:hypothetical protein
MRSVLDQGSGRLDTAISTANLAKHLRAENLPAAASRSAGAYLCNYLYYLSLHWARQQDAPCDVTFVHLPPGPRQGGPLSESELLRGAELILSYLLAFARIATRRSASPARWGRSSCCGRTAMNVSRRDMILAGLGLGVALAAGPRVGHARWTVPSTFGVTPLGGAIDQTAMLQSAIDAAAKSRIPLFLPPGIYSTRRLG